MSNFDLWLKACEEFNTRIYPLEESGECRLFKTTSDYTINGNIYHTEPVYHVWVGDKCVVSINSYIAAYKKWERCAKERSTDGGKT